MLPETKNVFIWIFVICIFRRGEWDLLNYAAYLQLFKEIESIALTMSKFSLCPPSYCVHIFCFNDCLIVPRFYGHLLV